MTTANHLRPQGVPPPPPSIDNLAAVKCLSIRQPFASLLVAGIRPIECRSWATDYRGPLIVHAASSRASLNKDVWLYLSEVAREIERDNPDDPESLKLGAWLAENWYSPLGAAWKGGPLGAILGVVDLVDCQDDPYEMVGDNWLNSITPWLADDVFNWRVVNPRRLATPIPCSGKLSLWRPPVEILQAIAKIL